MFTEEVNAVLLTFVGCSVLISSNPCKCVLASTEECKIRPALVNINVNEHLSYPYSVTANK